MKRLLYVVSAMHEELEVESNTHRGTVKIEMKWAEGQIGALPVFSDLEAAVEYAGGPDNVLCFSIVEDDHA